MKTVLCARSPLFRSVGRVDSGELGGGEDVDATKGTCPTLIPASYGQASFGGTAEAVTSILSTRDRVFSFRGVAGAGKTTTLRKCARTGGSRSLLLAITPTSSAARVLLDEGFAQATTVENFLRNAEKRGKLRRAVVICDERG